MKALGRVKEKFPDTKHFIEDLIDEECQKEKISANEEIFFTNFTNFFTFIFLLLFCSEYVKRYFIS